MVGSSDDGQEEEEGERGTHKGQNPNSQILINQSLDYIVEHLIYRLITLTEMKRKH